MADRNLTVGIDGRVYRAHRLAWLYMTGDWPKGDIDHQDGDGHNNRWRNLRDVSHAVNGQNRRGPARGNSSGFLGVSFEKFTGRYTARISIGGGRQRNLGRYDRPEDAYAAYLEAKRQHHEGCTI